MPGSARFCPLPNPDEQARRVVLDLGGDGALIFI